MNNLIVNPKQHTDKIMIGVPTTGLIRIEWALARYGQATPTNWAWHDFRVWLDTMVTLGFSVADARNIIATAAVDAGVEWIFFLDHDVILPPGALLKLNAHMSSAKNPIVSGLYFTNSTPAEPLIYRGRGNGYFADWKLGDMVRADGCGLGCVLIHTSIFRALYDECPQYQCADSTPRRFFHTPSKQAAAEGEANDYGVFMGTEDLPFYEMLQRDGVYAKAGWGETQSEEFPVLVDTSIMCKHITPSGVQYPVNGEALRFMTPEQRQRLAVLSR